MSTKRDHWKPISLAPNGLPIAVLTAGGYLVKAFWEDAAVESENGTCGAWLAAEEDQHPPCWTDGVCWTSNEDYEPSDPPVLWTYLPVIRPAPVSGEGE